jgi:glycosyltransferase involved in cell wall biosynthesis
MTAGRLESGPELQAAVWAFDMLRYEFPDLYLLIFGTGPDRAGVEAFGRALAFDDYRVRFPGYRPDLPALLGLAEVVWVTQERGGVNLALEAMAAGRPVVGWKSPDLVEVVDEGETGFLVDPKERALIAARTHGLLSDPDSATNFGAAGRARVAERFGSNRMVELFRRVYESVVAGQ